MALTGEEIRRRLIELAGRWSVYEGSERSEAQTFCNELFRCYGQERSSVAQFEAPKAGRFLDLLWPSNCLIEMKAPAEAGRLERHRPQALGYWQDAADPEREVPSPRFMVICAFRRLEVWEPGAFPGEPRAVLDLVDLPDQYDALLFLAGREPVFAGGRAAVTRETVATMVDFFHCLRDRRAAEVDELRDLLLQAVWCMFAEALGMIPTHGMTRVVDGLLERPERSSADDLGGLFDRMNTPGAQRPATASTPASPTSTAASSSVPPTCTWNTRSSSCCGRPATRTGRRSSPRSSARCSRAPSGTTPSGRSAPTTPTRPTSARRSARPSSSPGASGSKTSPRMPRPRPPSTTSLPTSCSTLPAARATSSTSPTASCAAWSSVCTSGLTSCGRRRGDRASGRSASSRCTT